MEARNVNELGDALKASWMYRTFGKIWHTERMYLSPDEKWQAQQFKVGAIDVWALGIVVTTACGYRFTDGLDEHSIQTAWLEHLGNPLVDAGFRLHIPLMDTPPPRKEWPEQLVSTLGPLGMELMTSLLTLDPRRRIQVGIALDHPFLQEGDLPLLGVEHKDMPELIDTPEGHGRSSDRLITPNTKLNVQPLSTRLSGQTISPGTRHRWSIRACVLGSDTRMWIQADDAFKPGTVANDLLVQMVLTPIEKQEKRCVHIGGKVRIGGHLGTCSGESMIKIYTNEPCPVSRAIDFMTAFKRTTIVWVRSTGLRAKAATKRLGRSRQGNTAGGF